MIESQRRRPSEKTSSEDRDLFRQAVGPVRELQVAANLVHATRPLPEPLPLQSDADERQVLRELLSADEGLLGLASGEVLTHLQDGYPPKLLRQLRRGQFVVEAELDLHHLRIPQARALLGSFLAQCGRERRRCVRIVHGKGKASDQGSVMKALTDRVLRQRADVLGFTSARPQDGGTGAVMVLLLVR